MTSHFAGPKDPHRQPRSDIVPQVANDGAPVPPRVYLAGPGVFRADAKAYGASLKAICLKHKMEGLFPLDSDSSSSGDVAAAIYRANLALINSSAAIIADISSFRGPNMDPGTAWEIGYAVARGLPVFVWSHTSKTLLERTRALHRLKENDHGWRDKDNLLVEDFGLVENLMIAVPAKQVFTSFEEAASTCSRHLTSRK
jgi:nucleoside 2-deoxyribosyltransferase